MQIKELKWQEDTAKIKLVLIYKVWWLMRNYSKIIPSKQLKLKFEWARSNEKIIDVRNLSDSMGNIVKPNVL